MPHFQTVQVEVEFQSRVWVYVPVASSGVYVHILHLGLPRNLFELSKQVQPNLQQ